MLFRGIGLSLCVLAAWMAVSSEGLGSEIYFDVHADLLPDTELIVKAGDAFVVSVYLSGFDEQTGSFQFDIYYDDSVLALLDYDTYVGQPDTDPGLTGPIQTLAELGPWATSQWSEPVPQELNQAGGGGGARLEFYTAGSFTETATGDGILAYLVFEATGLGQTTLDLQMPGGTWFLEDVAEQPTPTNLTATVIPEPMTLGLVLLGSGLLIIRGKSRR